MAKKVTGKRANKAASKVLRHKRTSKGANKIVAGSAQGKKRSRKQSGGEPSDIPPFRKK